MFDRSTSRFVTSVFLIFFFFSSSLGAQSLPAAPADSSRQESPVTNLDEKPLKLPARDDLFSKGFARQLLSDQKPIWTSPARIKASDAKWLVPLAAGTTFLFTKDNQIIHKFDNNSSLHNSSLKVSNIGLYSTWAVPGTFLALGKFTGNDRMADTGKRGFQVALYSTAVMQAMKLITDRARPLEGGNGHFWTGGDAFPSGHSMEAWALAKVVSDEYSDKPLVKIGMYSFATAISLSRITSQRHYASDVLVGSAVGYLIGKFVMRNHHVTPNNELSH
ncbi:MAG TPA: phosphatase PAP2 family protein [Terriglobia bacterium]|nr:phosphatase PAP2 family protein [Terriglobia bacterium]